VASVSIRLARSGVTLVVGTLWALLFFTMPQTQHDEAAAIDTTEGCVLPHLGACEGAAVALERSLDRRPDRPHRRDKSAVALRDWARKWYPLGDHAVRLARLRQAEEEARCAAREMPNHQQVQTIEQVVTAEIAQLEWGGRGRVCPGHRQTGGRPPPSARAGQVDSACVMA
jgi:hypothetical protein